jgi:hypothetical protein
MSFINSVGLSPSCIGSALDGFGSILLFLFWFLLALSVFTFFFRISNSVGLRTNEETQVVEMRIWRIEIGIVIFFFT